MSEFIHSAGRIGRDGKEGTVVVFLNAHNKKTFPGLVKLCKENHIQLPNRMIYEMVLCIGLYEVMKEDGS